MNTASDEIFPRVMGAASSSFLWCTTADAVKVLRQITRTSVCYFQHPVLVTHTHTHIHTCMHICIFICVLFSTPCFCYPAPFLFSILWSPSPKLSPPHSIFPTQLCLQQSVTMQPRLLVLNSIFSLSLYPYICYVLCLPASNPKLKGICLCSDRNNEQLFPFH